MTPRLNEGECLLLGRRQLVNVGSREAKGELVGKSDIVIQGIKGFAVVLIVVELATQVMILTHSKPKGQVLCAKGLLQKVCEFLKKRCGPIIENEL